MRPNDVLDLQKELKRIIFGQDEMIESATSGFFSGGNVLLIGPPSCAKTRLTKSILNAVNAASFYLQMSVGTRAEHIIGDIDVKELRETGRIVHRPDRLLLAEIAGLDEFLMIPPETQKTINEILEDRTFENKPVPVVSVICLSNPAEIDPSVYDRFSCVYEASGIIERKDKNSTEKLIRAVDTTLNFVSKIDDFPATVGKINSIEVGAGVYSILASIVNSIAVQNNLPMYDRTIKHCLRLLRFGAWMNGNGEVGLDDFQFLHHVFQFKTSLTMMQIGAIIAIAKEIGYIKHSIFVTRNKKDAINHHDVAEQLLRSYSVDHPMRSELVLLRTQIEGMADNDPIYAKISAQISLLTKASGKEKRTEAIEAIKKMLRIEVQDTTRSGLIVELTSSASTQYQEMGVRWTFRHDPSIGCFIMEPVVPASTIVKGAGSLVASRNAIIAQIKAK